MPVELEVAYTFWFVVRAFSLPFSFLSLPGIFSKDPNEYGQLPLLRSLTECYLQSLSCHWLWCELKMPPSRHAHVFEHLVPGWCAVWRHYRTFRRGSVAVDTGYYSVSLCITCTGDWDRGIFRDRCSVCLSLWCE